MRKVAIIAFGLEHCRRGVETHARMLFENLAHEGEFQVTLIKGSGSRNGSEVVLSVPKRHTMLNRFLGRLRGYDIYWEQVFFMIRLAFHLLGNRYDVLYTQEYVHLIGIGKLKKWLGWNTRIVYCEGFVSHIETRTKYADILQEVNASNYQFIQPLAMDKGVDVRLIPHFFDPISDTRSALEHDVLRELEHFTKDYRTILYVGPTELPEKNFEKLQRAFISLDLEWRMIICGDVPEERILLLDPTGERLKTCYVNHATMQRIYPMADVFILPSLEEAFGIATLEAMGHGIPVLLHDNQHSRWLSGDEEQCIDMTREGSIGRFLQHVTDWTAYKELKGRMNQEHFMKTFTWECLREKYLELFR